jgi:hypothetical protein
MVMLRKLLLSIALPAISCIVYAAPMEQLPVYTSARWLGRGGAMTADVDDYNVIFVNPAGLPLIKEPVLDFEFQLEGSGGITDNLTAFFGYSDKWKVTNPSDLNSLIAKDVSTRVSFLTAYVTDTYAIALISRGTMNTAYDTATPPNADVFSATDVTLQLTYGKGFLDNSLRVGGTGKLAYRTGRFGTFTMKQLETEGLKPFGQLSQEGLAFSFDVGIQYSWFMEGYDVNIGGSALDLATPFGLDPRITKGSDNGRPPILPARIDIGTGIKVHNIGAGIAWRTNLDVIKSITHMEASVFDLLHFGTELQFPRLIFLRAGIYQGYWTAGLGIKYYILECDFATYATDTALYYNTDGRRASDRRYDFQFSFMF